MKGLWVVTGVLLALLFIGGPAADDARLYKGLWDFGHVVLFALLVLLALRLPLLSKQPAWILLLMVALLAPALGLAIEYVQLWVGRDFEYADVLADSVGAFAGLALHYGLQSRVAWRVRLVAWLGMSLLLLFALRSMLMVGLDQFSMREEFPVLADFETRFEMSRWDTNLAQLEITREQARYGEHALRVQFMAGEYPDITLLDFVRDWRGFKSVRFSIFSTLNHPVAMELKMYDQQHAASGYDYADRFNRELLVQPGWNDIEVNMDELQTAPRSRDMDLQNMQAFSVFIEQLAQPAVFYFDALRLSSKSSLDAP